MLTEHPAHLRTQSTNHFLSWTNLHPHPPPGQTTTNPGPKAPCGLRWVVEVECDARLLCAADTLSGGPPGHRLQTPRSPTGSGRAARCTYAGTCRAALRQPKKLPAPAQKLDGTKRGRKTGKGNPGVLSPTANLHSAHRRSRPTFLEMPLAGQICVGRTTKASRDDGRRPSSLRALQE